MMEYKKGYQERDKIRIAKLAEIQNQINDKVDKIKKAEAAVNEQKQNLNNKKKEAQELVKAAQEGKLNPDDM